MHVMSLGFYFLGTVVQSAITSAMLCEYNSIDGSCSGGLAKDCEDVCFGNDVDCSTGDCHNLAVGMLLIGMPAWDQCWNFFADLKATCEDDGTSPCEGFDLCTTMCLSGTGQCDYLCVEVGSNLEQIGSNLEQINCDWYEQHYLPMAMEGFTGWNECFSLNGTIGMSMSCDESGIHSGASDSDDTRSSTDNTLIIGIVVGGVVFVIAIIAAVICIKSRKKVLIIPA